MSKRPGEGWVPSLTLPPLPGAGVLGVVESPGPTSMPGGPLVELSDVSGARRQRDVCGGRRCCGALTRECRGRMAEPERHHDGDPGAHEQQSTTSPQSEPHRSQKLWLHQLTTDVTIETMSGAKMASA